MLLVNIDHIPGRDMEVLGLVKGTEIVRRYKPKSKKI